MNKKDEITDDTILYPNPLSVIISELLESLGIPEKKRNDLENEIWELIPMKYKKKAFKVEKLRQLMVVIKA